VLKNEPATDPVNAKDEPLAYPEKLIWTSNEQVQKILDTAQQQARDLINNTESCLFQTDIYGSRFIKEIAKASPDSFVQIALQLAYYRLHKQPTAVYESASSRLFAYGRTETGRSLSSESLEFCKAFDNDDVLYADKKILFDRAIKTQNTYMKEASVGKGIDRHLMGLRLMLKPDETTDFFSDPSFSKSQYFRLSTSNMSPGKYFYGGFGPVVEEGYGINYAIDKDILKFSISSRKSCKQTNSFKFRDMLERVIIDLFILFPKRSEVWGYDWKLKHQEEKKVEYRVGEMRRLSDELKKKQEVMAERYRDK
jgi:carnitine O-acetyltransferase